MKTKRKIFSVLMTLIVFIQIFSNVKLNILAAGGFYSNDSFSLTANAVEINGISTSAYTMIDETGIPDGWHYFMKVEEGKCIACSSSEVVTNILNKKLGVTMSVTTLANFITSYLGNNQFTGFDPNYYSILVPVMRGEDIVGVALNNLTGCKLAYATGEDQITIPSEEVNNVYNYFNYYTINVLPDTPDIIQMPIASKTEALNNIDTYNNGTSNKTFLNSLGSDIYSCFRWYNNQNQYTTQFAFNGSGSSGSGVYIIPTGSILVAKYANDFNNIVSKYSLTNQNSTVTLLNYTTNMLSSDWVNFLVYDSNLTKIESHTYKRTDGTTNTVTYGDRDVGCYGYYYAIPVSTEGGYITVYKNVNIPTSIQNNTYSKNYYTSTNTNNFSTTNNNSYTTTVNNINNSQTTNSQIYNESKTQTNINIQENEYNVDNSVNDNSVTYIINNYYGDDSGGGGDDDDDDDDDDTIWKALLKAIAGFFEKIGELIATLLTGIFSIFTSILDAITSITEDFTSITSFISSFFSWLPAPITSLIVLGLGLALICAFLTWFKK